MDVRDPLLDPNFKLLVSSNDSDSESPKDRKRSSKSRSSSSKKRKSKHHRQHKSKSKKKHKTHSKRSSSSSEEEDQSESASESEEDEWVEKLPSSTMDKRSPKPDPKPTFQKSPASEDIQDMDLFNLMPTYSNESKKKRRVDEKRTARELSSIDQVGLHERELNPYWKNGGTGLPTEDNQGGNPVADKDKKPSSSTTSTPVGDGGLSWLKKSYQRAKEQAKEEGRSLEEVAAERWGSLSNFFSMLEEAERKASKGDNRGRGSDRSERREREREDNRRHRSFKRPDRDSDEEAHSSKSDSYSSSKSHIAPSRRRGWKKDGSQDDHVERSKKERTPEELKRRSRSRSPFSPPKAEVKEESDSESKEEDDKPEKKVLTDQEMNALNAKIIKAELLSNTVLVEQLKNQLEQAKKDRDEFIKSGGKPNSEKRVVTKVIMDSNSNQGGRRKKDKITETHKDGQRVRYFPDDDKQSLANMFQKEKMNTIEDENALFSRLAGQKIKPTEDYDLDDIFADKASSSKNVRKEQERDIRKVVDEEKQYQRTLADCNWCFEGKMQKNIVIAIGEKSFLCVPPFQSLTDGHCIIVPMSHSCSSTSLDEDVWAEIQKFRQAIVKMFSDADQDVVVFESAVYLKNHPHMYIECVPMPKEVGELAPIYFKKAIQECETEWSQNKKLVDLRGKDIRRGVPKGLPYFWVDFGLDSGFAHVIEDEKYFPKNFAQEIIGGMMELDHHLWRKQKLDDFNAQKEKVMEFLKMWGPYDWTR